MKRQEKPRPFPRHRVVEGDVDRALSKLSTVLSSDAPSAGAGAGAPLPRLDDLDAVVRRVLRDSDEERRAVPCQPWDYEGMLERARTFQSSRWFAKPDFLHPLVCARYGWVCTARDTLGCLCCDAKVVVSADLGAEEAAERLASSHGRLCPWAGSPCPETFLAFQASGDADLLDALSARLASFDAFAAELAAAAPQLGIDGLLSGEPPALPAQLADRVREATGSAGAGNEAAVLAALGWSLSAAPGAGGGEGPALRCALCGARRSVVGLRAARQKGKAKRRRSDGFGAVDSHKLWCPYVTRCGGERTGIEQVAAALERAAAGKEAPAEPVDVAKAYRRVRLLLEQAEVPGAVLHGA